MKHKYYVLCGENGLMIKAGYHKYPKVLEMLNTYLKGKRFIKGCSSLVEAQDYACNYAARQDPSVLLYTPPLPDQMILFREQRILINPIVPI